MKSTISGASALDEPDGWVLLLTAAHDVRAVPIAERGSIVIGRDPACDVVLDDDRVSRRHARITTGAWTIEDLGSRGGTRIAGAAIEGATPFVAGQPIKLGPYTAVVVPRPVSAVRVVVGASSLAIEDPTLARPTPLVDTIAKSQVSIVIHGETGSGKEVLARALHALSARAGAFLAINCAALPADLLESELFGHEKGAFTGAVGKIGLLEAADGGTVLLDEIAEMSIELQAKLLRAIEAREIVRVGSVTPRKIGARFFAASHRDLLAACATGTFRQDLFYRLAGITLAIPPLRHRMHQLAPLAQRFARDATGLDDAITPAALARLTTHGWPGNVRELANVIERAALFAAGERIDAPHVIFDEEPAPEPDALDDARALPATARVDRAQIIAALEACGGNQGAAAKQLGISRATLIRRLDELGVPRPRKR
ncbi:MAG TPA: sigma 54-interacting transcriptional regulator [Kofleriaceae bacterium]|nr:sigma 54-interacting transcriptional regulator [Kofleriaceae bacterium]